LKLSANNSLALNKLRILETSKIEPIENSATNPVDTQPTRHRNVAPKISDEQNARIKCPSCASSMPSWYAVCENCGYALVELSKPIPYFAGGNSSNTYLNQCPKCHGKSISTKGGIGTIILHIILIFITSGLWLLVLLVWALVSPKQQGKYKCNTCGYEWG
jgi:Zn finger protein HypA/HybF involved in hydrogenase expression